MENRLKYEANGTGEIEGKSSGSRSFRNDVAKVVTRLDLFYVVTCHLERS